MDPREALVNAHRSLTDGPGEPTSIEGAKVNALESIAWSLMGLLADRVGDEASQDLSSSLKKLGLVDLER